MPHPLATSVGWFEEGQWPALRCGSCGRGRLSIEGDERTSETGQSERLHNHEGWEPEWISGTFSATLRCTDPECADRAECVGDWRVDYASRSHHGQQYASHFKIRAVWPSPVLIDLPDGTPDQVRDLVKSAASILWLDPSSAANRLRTSIEHLLTAQHVKRQQRVPNKKVRKYSLHERIDLFRARRPDVAEQLEAVKWIGNEGSHEEGLSADQVLAGAEHLEHALDLLYDPAPATLKARARKINKRRGL